MEQLTREKPPDPFGVLELALKTKPLRLELLVFQPSQDIDCESFAKAPEKSLLVKFALKSTAEGCTQ